VSTTAVGSTQLRVRFAAALSALYGTEVPAYTTLVEVAHEVNLRVLDERGASAQRLGSIERVTAERHGAIRVGSPRELSQVARIFGALGMHPVGFYDLRDASPQPVPVVSTAFRPLSPQELARNPFRVFTSVLVPEDRRFFGADLEQELKAFIGARRLFPDELLELADRAEAHGELPAAAADRFIELATGAFALSREPVDRAWYTRLERISGVAADIGGVSSTHINHLTPRVLDIDELYRRMGARGIEMIDRIQGPPRWDGPDVLLRQTSFRALAEPRTFSDAAGRLSEGSLRVRFGEVEARGIALTPAGRELYDRMAALVEQRTARQPDADRQEAAAQVWREHLPRTERELCLSGLGFFTYEAAARRPGGAPPASLPELVEGGWVEPQPIVYEDFLPASAAGIFASNLTGAGSVGTDQGGTEHSDTEQRGTEQGGAVRSCGWLAEAIGREVNRPEELYAAQSRDSLHAALRALSGQAASTA
jgi:uncharacterized glyoxalase superfamily metalloenzyme YdcJ